VERFVERNAERELIAPRRRLLAEELLRRHIRGRPHDRAEAGDRLRDGVTAFARNVAL
jgi:hypothetical protein